MSGTTQRPRVRVPARSAPVTVPTTDSYVNFAARVGRQVDALSSQGFYGAAYQTRDRSQLDNMYRGSWIIGQAVDVVADDMTRAGIEIQAPDLDPADVERLLVAMRELSLWERLNDVVKWSRLYGGAIGVLLVDGQDPSTPLRIETVALGQFKGIVALDRWLLEPSLTDLIQAYGPDLGMPNSYRVLSQVPGLAGKVIHHSRVVRIDGIELPFFQREAENGWGQSVVERIIDRLMAFDSTTQGTAQLVFRANLRTYQMEGLWQTIAGGGPAFAALLKRMEWMRSMQTNEGLTLVDGKDTFNTHTYSFTGLSDVLAQFGSQLAGALGIPLTRLFGQSPAGFSTGDADIRNYYDNVHQQQERRLRRPLTTILALLCRSKLGIDRPAGMGFDFTSLWQMSDKERAEIAATIGSAVGAAEGSGIISRATALNELRRSSEITGVFGQITDEEIEEAEAEPPPAPEGFIADPVTGELIPAPNPALPPVANDDNDADSAAEPLDPPRARARDEAGFREADHPRDHGKFATKPGASGSSSPGPGGGGSSASSEKRQDASGERKAASSKQPSHVLHGTVTRDDGARVQADGSPLPEHITALKLPPAWKDVRFNPDPKGTLLAQGKDAKGRPQSVYSAEFSAQQAAAKFSRVDALAAEFPAIMAQNAEARRSSNPRVRDAADCLHLVALTGVRPGSERDTGADKEAVGATTLRGEHVHTEAGGTYLRFTGKKGVSLRLRVESAELAGMLRERAAKAGADGQLFPTVNERSLLDHAHGLGSGIFKSKDFRTHLGTASAAAMVRSMPAPTNERERKRAINDVAKHVAAKLGNTPTIALASYISPVVFSAWGGESKS